VCVHTSLSSTFHRFNTYAVIDTAEAYGFGLSEQLINEFGARDGGRRPVIATKFAPLPWRSGRADVVKAARGSCARLGASRVGLYQCHWPGALPGQTEAYVDGLGDVLDAGLAAGVGVSNFKASRVEAAAAALGGRVSTNQVQYSLLYRTPEDNGVVSATQGAGATIIAYSPLAQGLLTGKYEDGGPLPTGPRAATITASRVKAVAPLIAAMRAVGAGHAVGGVAKTPAQVALNWCMAKGTLPIPGVKSARQATEASGALGWRMSRAEVEELDAVSSKIAPGLAFPTEKW
jgi:aryl-alcohol dehydrogenase-like predicted oxidoreductase